MMKFEKDILKEFLAESDELDLVISSLVSDESVEFSGSGYFVTLKSTEFPKSRIVLNKPDVRGTLSGVDVGFIVFIENSQLMFECYTYGDVLTPEQREGEFLRDST